MRGGRKRVGTCVGWCSLGEDTVGLDDRSDVHNPSNATATCTGCDTDVLGIATISWNVSNRIRPATAVVSSSCGGLERDWFDFRPRVPGRRERRRFSSSSASRLWLRPRTWISSSSCTASWVQRRTCSRSTRRRAAVVDGLRGAAWFVRSHGRCVADSSRQGALHVVVCNPRVVPSTFQTTRRWTRNETMVEPKTEGSSTGNDVSRSFDRTRRWTVSPGTRREATSLDRSWVGRRDVSSRSIQN